METLLTLNDGNSIERRILKMVRNNESDEKEDEEMEVDDN